jgi:aspartyl-tRNA(Asn)/glutamyl-tRNA(Gln) amidotransferase subunit A
MLTALKIYSTYETLFLPAQSARRLIQKEFDNVFKQPNLLYNDKTKQGLNEERVDVLLVPSATSPAPTLNKLNDSGGGIEEYINDVMTLPANLAGIPAITIPQQNSNKDDYPIGLQLLGQYGYDKFILHVAEMMLKK